MIAKEKSNEHGKKIGTFMRFLCKEKLIENGNFLQIIDMDLIRKKSDHLPIRNGRKIF